jgi:hypothetical protein
MTPWFVNIEVGTVLSVAVFQVLETLHRASHLRLLSKVYTSSQFGYGHCKSY